jgi:hypothetical protein
MRFLWETVHLPLVTAMVAVAQFCQKMDSSVVRSDPVCHLRYPQNAHCNMKQSSLGSTTLIRKAYSYMMWLNEMQYICVYIVFAERRNPPSLTTMKRESFKQFIYF